MNSSEDPAHGQLWMDTAVVGMRVQREPQRKQLEGIVAEDTQGLVKSKWLVVLEKLEHFTKGAGDDIHHQQHTSLVESCLFATLQTRNGEIEKEMGTLRAIHGGMA